MSKNYLMYHPTMILITFIKKVILFPNNHYGRPLKMGSVLGIFGGMIILFSCYPEV